MAKKHIIISKFNGYSAKTDVTNLGDGYLISGSQNVVTNDGERIQSRKGYTLDGAANANLYPVISSYEWQTHRGLEIPVRSYNTVLEFRYSGTWYTLESGFSSVSFNFTEYWDTTEKEDFLLFVNGTSNIYNWSGGITTFASATINTITKQGATTWAQEGFYANGVRKVRINGVDYTYTGGETTTTITGVTPDPTGAGIAVGTVISQTLRTQATTPTSGYNNDLIATLNNQIWVGSTTRRDVYVSKINDFTSYTFSTPRLVGEGALLTLDSSPVAFIIQEDTIYISAGKNDWYNILFQQDSTLANETLFVKKLKNAPQQASISQFATSNIKNDVVFISNENTLDTLGRVLSINTPQSVPLSDPIKSDFDSYNFSNAHIKYYKNNIYVALPSESKVLIYNLQKKWWEAPQILPVRRLAIIGGLLYGHSNSVPETYKLLDGYNDNGNAINAIAAFSYQNFGHRSWKKRFTEWFSEGYIQSNTVLSLTLNYDYTGITLQKVYTINGGDSSILFNLISDGSLGKESLGKLNLAGKGETISDVLPPKFRQINTTVPQDFYEMQVVYSTNDIDQRWELLAFGPDSELSTYDNQQIKK